MPCHLTMKPYFYASLFNRFTGVSSLHEFTLTQKFVYDLGDILTTLRAVADLEENEHSVEDWLMEHLRQCHYLNVDLCSPPEKRRSAMDVYLRCERYAVSVEHSLYQLFLPMSYRAQEASFTNVKLNHNILTVAVYDCYG